MLMRALLLASITVASACSQPPSPIGQKFRAKVKIATQTGCPMINGLSPTRYERELVFGLEKHAVGFSRATIEPYDVVVGDPEDGVCPVRFTVGENWTTGTIMIPVITAYEGTAQWDNLDLLGTVSFPQPDPATDGCVMTTTIWGYDDGL